MKAKDANRPNNLCGNPRCLNGWIWWSGSEYPCDACTKISRARSEAARAEALRAALEGTDEAK